MSDYRLPKHYREICKNCNCTYGAHNGTKYFSDYYNMEVPADYCPGHEGQMDWDNGPGTTFQGSGEVKKEE